MAAAVATYGHVDILIGNHAYGTSEQQLATVTAEEIDHHFVVNVRGTLLLVQAFAAQHDGREGGRVVFLISGQERFPMEGELAYSASKAAVNTLRSPGAVRRKDAVTCYLEGRTLGFDSWALCAGDPR